MQASLELPTSANNPRAHAARPSSFCQSYFMPEASATSLRMALIIHALHGGGAERLMSQLANRWAEAGHDVHLITLAAVDTDVYPLDARIERHGLNLMRTSRNRAVGMLANVQRVRQLGRLLGKLKPGFALSFCDRMNIVTATAAPRTTGPLWLSEHSDPRKQQLGRVWEAWRDRVYRRATGLVVLNDSIKQAMQQRFPGLPIAVIPPAITPPAHLQNAQGSPLPQATTVGERRQRLLTLGRHSHEKNLLGLLAAWRALADQYDRWTLVLAGDGPQHAELVRASRELGLSDRVEFTGWVDDPWSLMASCDALVLSSFYEGFPVTLLEAMSVGLPCVSTPASESVLALVSAGAVELARSPEANDLTEGLRRVLGSTERRHQLAQAGRAVAAQYSWSAIGPLWDQLLPQSSSHSLQ